MGLRSGVAFLRACKYLKKQVSVQHGLVGVHHFRWGVFTISTLQMAKELPSAFFKVLGSMFAVVVILLWLVVSAGTIRGVITRQNLLRAMCSGIREGVQCSEDQKGSGERH